MRRAWCRSAGVRIMDRWRVQAIPGAGGPTSPSPSPSSPLQPGYEPHTATQQYQSVHQSHSQQYQQQQQADGAFERFLTAAIATIITIMFSWRMIDQANTASSEPLAPRSYYAGGNRTPDEDEEEERRRRRERYLRGGVVPSGEVSENVFAASSPLLLSSHPSSSSSPLYDRGGSNISPGPSLSSSSSSSPSTPTNSARRRQLPPTPGLHHPGDIHSSLSSTTATTTTTAAGSSRFQQQQGESLASRLAKISGSSTRPGGVRARPAAGGVGFRLTNLSPVIRVPVEDLPLCGDGEDQGFTPDTVAEMDIDSKEPDLQQNTGNPQKVLLRQDTPHPGAATTSGVISETLVDPRQLSALGLDPWSIGKPSGGLEKLQGPVLYTDLDADSSDELVDSSLEDAESAAGLGLPGRAGDPGGGGVGGLGRDLLLNISTDSDSSGGIITKNSRDSEIVDPKRFHAVMTAKLVDTDTSGDNRQHPRSDRFGGGTADVSRGDHDGFYDNVREYDGDADGGDDDDEFLVLPSDSSYRHRYTGRRDLGSNNYNNNSTSNRRDGDTTSGDSSSTSSQTSRAGGGILGFTSYYYEDEDDDDDVQPRELDSDEELYLCSVLEPIIEENSDELSPSSGAESCTSSSTTTTSSSRSGSKSKSRHKRHDYDVEYQERKHGLIPTPQSPGSSSSIPRANRDMKSIPPVSGISAAPLAGSELSSLVEQPSVESLESSSSTLLSSEPSVKSLNSEDNDSGIINSGNIRDNDSVCETESSTNNELYYSGNDSLIMGIRAKYSIPSSVRATTTTTATSGNNNNNNNNMQSTHQGVNQPTTGLELDNAPDSVSLHSSDTTLPYHHTSQHHHFPSPAATDTGDSRTGERRGSGGRLLAGPRAATEVKPADDPGDLGLATAAGGQQVRGENSLNRDGRRTVLVAAGPDRPRGDTHTAEVRIDRAERGSDGGGGGDSTRPSSAYDRSGEDYESLRSGNACPADASECGVFPQHTLTPLTSVQGSRSSGAGGPSSTFSLDTNTTGGSEFITGWSSSGLRLESVPYDHDKEDRSRSSDDRNAIIEDVGLDLEPNPSSRSSAVIYTGVANNNNTTSEAASDSSTSSNSDKTIAYNFYSDLTTGVYSSRIIVTGEQEEEVANTSLFEDNAEEVYYSDSNGATTLGLNRNPIIIAGDANASDQLSVSFPTDADYYEYVRCYGSSVDLDSPTSPQPPTSPVGRQTSSDLGTELDLRQVSKVFSSSFRPVGEEESVEKAQLPQQLSVKEASLVQQKHPPGQQVRVQPEDDSYLPDVRSRVSSDRGPREEDRVCEESVRREARSFARTFSTRVDLQDSNSESDESVQTVISRKGSKVGEATSSSSAGSSHHDSPVHAPSALSPPVESRPKRPLSDGYVYVAKKVLREEQGKDAFFRDRIVSEGGGVAFGEDTPGIGDDEIEPEEQLNYFDLRAYRSYSALHTKGLDSLSDEEKENTNNLRVFSDSGSSSPASPQFVSSTSPIHLNVLSNSDNSLPEPLARAHQAKTSPADVIKTTTISFDGADSLTFVVDPQKTPDATPIMEGRGFRLSREEEEDMYRYGAYRGHDERRVPEISEQQQQDAGDDDEEWEQSITETFVVPVSPERTIYHTLQNVKHLLDARPSSVEQDEQSSTCTTTMVEVDGHNAGGFIGNDYVTGGHRARADALERVDADLKERLGFKLSTDELRTEGYSTESGWPIVRYIEKERVFVDEKGVENREEPSVDAEDRVREGEEEESGGEEYVPDYTDIDAEYDQTEEKMEEDPVPRAEKPKLESQPHSYASSIPPSLATTHPAPYQSYLPSPAQSPATSHRPASAFPPPRVGRLGSSRSNMPPPPLPPTQAQVPEESFMQMRHHPELRMTQPLYTLPAKDSQSPVTSPESEPPPLPLVPPPSHQNIPPPSPAYSSAPQPSLLPEEEDFAYIPRGGLADLRPLSPESIPRNRTIPPSMPSTSSHSHFPHSTYQSLEAPPMLVRPGSPQPPREEQRNLNEGDEDERNMSGSSDGSDTRGNPPAEFAEAYRDSDPQDGDEDYEYFVKHIADGETEETPSMLLPDDGDRTTPLSAPSSVGIPILSGNLASPYAKRDVFLFPTDGSRPVTTRYPGSKTQSSPSFVASEAETVSSKPHAGVKSQDEDRTDARREESLIGEKRGVIDDTARESGTIEDESSAKKPRLVRTSTGTEEGGGFFSGPRRSSAASLLDDDSSNVLNRSFGEPTSTSLSFALERYDSEPAARSPTKERFAGSSPFRESPKRLSSRPMSAVSQEPSLDVVIEARADAPATMSSASSTASDVTVIAADALDSPTGAASPPLARTASLEQSPTLTAPPPQLPFTLPPVSQARATTDDIVDDTPSTPGESETSVLAEMEQRWDNSMKRVKRSKMDLRFADEEDSEGTPTAFSPAVEKDQIAQLAEKSPQIHPIFAEKQKQELLPKSFLGGRENMGQAVVGAERREENSDKSDEEGDSESEEDEESANDESEREATDVMQRAPTVRPVSLTPSSKSARPFESQYETRNQLRAGSNSVESADENYPAESPPSSGPMSPGISSDSASALEASPSSIKPVQTEHLLAPPPLQAASAVSAPSPSSPSPVGLTTRSQSSPLSIPFPGTAWAHAQFGQYDKPPKGASYTTPKRSMKEVKKMSKTPYKSVLTQNVPSSFTTPPLPSPKAPSFVVPDNFLTPSRLKILNSRNRFLSEGNIQNADDDYGDEFAAYKESLLNSSNSILPPAHRLYAPNPSTDSFSAKNWRYRSMEQLQKLQEMSRMTRKSESDLTHRHEGRHDCLHADCIFSEKGRREVLDKTLSIDNLHADVYKHLRRLGGSESDAGDAYFPESNSDLYDLTFNHFQNDGRGPEHFDRPHSMSELRHASDYSTISGGAGGYFDTPSSARQPGARSSSGRFAQHKQYKKSKSLCTLETNIDDETFGPSSPTSPGGEELGLQRAPSAHDLRISKSLQKLNVPKWYSQSSLSKYGSLSLLKYGSNSTMSSWQQLPSSLMSSPCTTPSASGNVVIKARVQPPTSARNLRSPRFPSKSAPTTPLFGTNGQQPRGGESPTVKLPSEKMRSQEKAKALMPIPIVPFDKIRAMFEKKKSENKAAKQQEAPPAVQTKKTASPTLASPPSISPPTYAPAPSHQAPRTLAINGRRRMHEDDEDDVYEDVEIVVPKVIVSPTDPHVKGILKRPSQSEKRYSDIQEAPEPDDEEPMPRPVPTRPVEEAPMFRLSQAPDLVAALPPHSPVSEPALEYIPRQQVDPVFSSSTAQPTRPTPESRPFEQAAKSPVPEKSDSSPKPPTPKPRSSGGFSFFKKKLSSSSLSSSSDKGSKKSPTTPPLSGSPNSSYDSADKFPVPIRSEEIPEPRAEVPNHRVPNSSFPSSDQAPLRPHEAVAKLEEAPVIRPPPSVHFPPEEDFQFHDSPSNHDVFPASSSAWNRLPEPRVHIQETNIDDSSEGSSAPTSPAHVPASYLPHIPPQTPPEPPSSSPPPRSPPAEPEAKPEKKRTWFPKPGRSKRTSKSPASSDRGKSPASSDRGKKEPPVQQQQQPPPPASPPPHNFQVEEMSYEPRRLRSSRSSGLDESFTSEGSRTFAPGRGRELERSAARPDLDRSRDSRESHSHSSRPSASRPVDLERRTSVESDRSFTRDLDRVSGRAAARAAPLDLDRSSGSATSDNRQRELTFRERRDRDLLRYQPDSDASDGWNHPTRDRRDRDPPYNSNSDGGAGRRDRPAPDNRRDRDDPRRYDMDAPAPSAPPSAGSRDRRSVELQDSSSIDTGSRRSIDHVDVAISRADRRPVEDPPRVRTWQPKPRHGRQLLPDAAKPPVMILPPAPSPAPSANGTASRDYRYPVSGSAFSASKPNMAPGLNTPPVARHQQPAASSSPPEEADPKSVRETTV